MSVENEPRTSSMVVISDLGEGPCEALGGRQTDQSNIFNSMVPDMSNRAAQERSTRSGLTEGKDHFFS